MKQSKLNLKHFALAAFVTCGALGANAAHEVLSADMLPRQLTTPHHVREFRGDKPFSVSQFQEARGVVGEGEAVVKPSISFDDMPRYDYLQGPDGSTWFYTVEYDFETIVHNPYWSEDMIMGYTFTIYDNLFNVVGTVKDKVRFAPNETRAREILLDAAVSRHFFNDDDNLEVMVQHVMNTEEYVNHYYSKVYSIGGEKDASNYDVSIATVEGRVADAINVGTPENEDFYYTIIIDPVVSFKGDTKSQAYIDYLNTLEYKLTTYGKSQGNGPVEVLSKGIGVTRVPGDTTDGIYFISKKQNGVLYFVYSQYELPYFVEPVVVTGDESATPDNTFILETYQVSGGEPKLLAKTVIPVDYPDSSEALRYAYYSVGSVAWANDVDMSVNGTPETPAFIIAHDIEEVATEAMTSSYEIYDHTGKLLRTIATGTESISVLDTFGGQPQLMFVTLNDKGEYHFSFANLYDGESLFSISQNNGGNPLTSACALVRTPDGEIMYAFEMREYEVDADYNAFLRVAWFDADGLPVKVDRVNLGKNIQAAMVNLDPAGLNPYIYDDDDEMEYAVLVKRTSGATTRNEFLIVDDSGKHYANFSADDGRGEPSMFTVLPGETNRVMMTYSTYYGYNVDLYDLPFVNIKGDDNKVDGITSDSSALTFDGATVTAVGSDIEVFTAAGAKVAAGHGAVAVGTLQPGVYVVVATNAAGNREIGKIRID